MGAGPRLVDFALLSCQFSVVALDADESEHPGEESPTAGADGEEAAPSSAPASEAATYEDGLDLEGVSLRYAVSEEDGLLVLILQTTLTEATAPYELAIVTGSRFTLADPPVAPEMAAATLVFVTYPYVREIFSNITARSPFQPFALPPLTTLPHPRVTGEQSESEQEEGKPPVTQTE